MKVEPTGLTMIGECQVNTPKCVARTPEPVTAVWTRDGRTQINVCRPCFEEQIRSGAWEVEGARVEAA